MSRGSASGSSYERLLLIGRGGMGEVYLARQRGIEGFERPVALKRILPGLGGDPELRRMFVNEARIMAGLSHPNLCQTVDLCTADSDLFLVLELLHGVDIGSLMKRVGPLPTPIVAAILLQACAGLEHAHARGLIHRDLSPSNLFLTSDGVLKILDFGVAKVKGTDRSSSGLKGNRPYMSPEQVAGKLLDERSDLFALGAVGLEALSGIPLFLRDSDYLTYQAILEGTRPVGLTTSPLDPILAPCLELEPASRPQSARDSARALRSAVQSVGGESSPHDLAGYLEHHMADELAALRTRMADALRNSSQEAPPILHTVDLELPEPSGYATTMASPAIGLPTTTANRGPAPTTDRGPAPTADRGPAPPQPQPRFQAPPEPTRRRGMVAAAVVAVAVFAVWLTVRATGAGETSPDASAPVAALPSPAAPEAPEAAALAADAAPPPSSADAAPPALPDAGASAVRTAPPASRRARQSGQVSIDATPFATISIDGKPVGTTPVLRYQLTEGTHAVVATTQDGRTQRFKIRVRAGKLTAKRLTFD